MHSAPPGHVFGAHSANQGDGFGRGSRLRRLGFGFVAPDQAEQLAVPAQQSVGLDVEGLPPERRRPGEEQKLKAVPIAELRVFDLALHDDQLVPGGGRSRHWRRDRRLGLAAHGILNHAYEERAGAGIEYLLDALTHVVDGVANVRSEAMENVEHAARAPGI
jgi:hypothetical protein